MSWIDDHIEYMTDFEDMQTYYRDSELDRNLCKDGLWRTAKNQIIKIEDMSTKHLDNAIALIHRQYPWRDYYLPILRKELNRR